MLQKFSVRVWYSHCRQQIKMDHFFMRHPVYVEWFDLIENCSRQ